MDKKNRNGITAIVIAIIAAATVIFSVTVSTGRFVEYKKTAASGGLSATGSASCNFESDLIVWRGGFTASSMNMKDAYGIIKDDAELVRKYLSDNGIANDEMVFSSVDIKQRYQSVYDEHGNYLEETPNGYDLYQTVSVTSTDIDKVETISRDITNLIESGVEFTSNSPEYYYTKLDEVKLELIEKATSNAKQRIDIMAAGSGCEPGELLTASLGVFQITAQNSGSGEYTYDGAFDTRSRFKTANITVRLNYAVK